MANREVEISSFVPDLMIIGLIILTAWLASNQDNNLFRRVGQLEVQVQQLERRSK